MDKGAMLELASRVEAASGKERERLKLNGDIAIALDLVPVGLQRGGDYAKDRWFSRGKLSTLQYQAPNYCASLDAALSLADKGWWLTLSAPLSPDAYGYSRKEERQPRARFEMMDAPYSVGARAATLPLALTAACLRALASQVDHAR